MKTRMLGLLLAVNVVLFAACCVLVVRLSRPSREGAPIGLALNSAESQVRDPAPVKMSIAAEVPHLTPEVRSNAFHWSQIESSDYRTYIANLRSVGCPESTIRDIILTDIMKLFAARRGQWLFNGREFRFWETDEKRALTAKQSERRDRELARIDRQVPAVLRELLGINYERELNKYFVDTGEEDRRLSFLPEGKRAQVLAVREQIEEMKERLFDQEGIQPDPRELQQLQERQKALLVSLLAPEEVEEFELRTSDTADRLRAELVGFNPTEEEFRQIFRLMRAHDEKFPVAQPGNEAAKAADLQRTEEAIRSSLRLDRVVEFDRSRNPDYRGTVVFAERFELPPSTADALLDFHQAVELERRRVLADGNISEESRAAALRAIDSETSASVRRLVGDTAYTAFQQGPGSWLPALNLNAASR